VDAQARSPAGQYIASASQDHAMQVWDAMTGQRLVIYRGHAAEV
jgi:WD40 repeat protein